MVEMERPDSESGTADRHGDHGGAGFEFFGAGHHRSRGESDGRRAVECVSNGPNGFGKSCGMMKTCRNQERGGRAIKFLSQ